MAGSWWDSAYRSGHIPWDPGEYDGHLPRLLSEFRIPHGAALDIGCGEGKSLLYLAERGYQCTGIDLSPTALRLAGDEARRRGLSCRWLEGDFPRDFAITRTPTATADGDTDPKPGRARTHHGLPAGAFALIMERGCFQHTGHPGSEARAFAHAAAELLATNGYYYSLVAADKGTRGPWGPRWSEQAVRKVLEEAMEIMSLELSVFTPGERGSMGAWLCVAKRRT